jgi:trehalose 6-phosphate synthase
LKHQDRQTHSRDRLLRLAGKRFSERKLVVVSNREPVIHERDGRDGRGRHRILHPASGMTTALGPVVESCGGIWVAHGSGSGDFDVTDSRGGLEWPPDAPTHRLRRVRLERDVEEGYYYGLANEGIWPLCHIAYTQPMFRHADWDAYRAANRAFADAVLDEIGDAPATVFVQDYHLALLPRMLRDARPDLLIAHFWHIPWPNREVIRVFPWQEEFLHGLLGSDLIGFHVRHHCHNFLDTLDRGIEGLVDWEHSRAIHGGRPTYIKPFPISIDADGFAALAAERRFEEAYPELDAQTRGQILLLGVDRLDYTKGITHRARMFEALLEENADLRGRVTLVQIGAPTRTVIPRYASLASEVQDAVDQVNTRFATDTWVPIRYLPEHHERAMLAPLFRRADACLVTSLHDGMNLVAKEYVAAHAGTPGTLLLSKFTGASREFVEACLVNPYDIEGSARDLAASLRLAPAIRGEAMRRLFERVRAHDVYDWAHDILRALDDVARREYAQRFPGN